MHKVIQALQVKTWHLFLVLHMLLENIFYEELLFSTTFGGHSR